MICLEQNSRILMNFIMDMNVRNNYEWEDCQNCSMLYCVPQFCLWALWCQGLASYQPVDLLIVPVLHVWQAAYIESDQYELGF